ncbi:MAG: EMC3/TMCO1 family protein [Nanoarchaeota archaeon]|nr:EMC3/TMCO1 family protein [Nanoarchaeota archaeon]
MAYSDFLNIIFSPLFKLPVLVAVIILSLFVSLIIILITKYTTNQSLMKKLKEEISGYQKQIKELKKEPAKAMEVQKKSMELNMKYMMHSLKPTIITFIPIILIFGWMSSNFAYESIKPQQEFSVTVFFEKNTKGDAELIVPEGTTSIGDKLKKIENDKATWILKGVEGEHILEFIYNDEKQQKSVLITHNEKYIEPTKKTNGMIKLIQIDYNPKKILNLFGWKLGWLGTYIIFSIIFTMSLRKVMKVY